MTLHPREPQAEPIAASQGPTPPDPIKERQYVRVYYPLDCPKEHLPELTIRYRSYPVLDISEAGLRFKVPRIHLLKEDILSGALKFNDESVVEFSGVVVRRTKDELALKLIKGIPYSFIVSEQVRLRNLEAEGVIKYMAG